MKNLENNELVDRRAAAVDARNALLNAYRAAQTADEPAKIARLEDRAAIASARDDASNASAEDRAPADAAALTETEALEIIKMLASRSPSMTKRSERPNAIGAKRKARHA
ncbi:DUF6481 family protein [Neorhizobium galegae]|uniref:DUF6481 family protein n=1 Tax=Neorhizobium galegae TaxID=399 RepID=UPI000ABC177B|nr:DUF6481 family protein [Neorhizobium galegae]MCQ1854528.1 DUF6481 family protein [Neorhizobium galegae]